MLSIGPDCFLIDENGSLWQFGSTDGNNLSIYDTNISSIPHIIPQLQNICVVSCGIGHVVCIDNSQFVWSFGWNNKGQLGHGNINNYSIPKQIEAFDIGCDNVICGPKYTICIDPNGYGWSFGENIYGQLAIGHSIDEQNEPRLIKSLSGILSVSCGARHIIIQTKDGKLYACGDNNNGQLGINIEQTSLPIEINNITNADQVSCGLMHTIILKNGDMYGFGNNSSGQIGQNEDIQQIFSPTLIQINTKIESIQCGYFHSICIDINGEIYSFGLNNTYQCGMKDNKKNIFTPTKINELSSISHIFTGFHNTIVRDHSNNIWFFGRSTKLFGIEQEGIPKQIKHDLFKQWKVLFNSRAKSARK